MDDRYKDFSEDSFEYEYPFSWILRNKDYLKLREDRENSQVEEQVEGQEEIDNVN